jgi:[ribosomal protein S5]-alanine N-acetyltransferase
VHPREWGHGHATRAVRAVTEWALGPRALARVWATCDAENTASARVLEKSGFVLEQRLRAHTVRPNVSPEPRDVLLYAQTR